jgi:hypothetical protein
MQLHLTLGTVLISLGTSPDLALQSIGFTLAANTSMRTSPGLGCGRG